jgi:hypothetical protein
MARIKEIPDEEAKKEEDIVKESVHYSDFYKAYGKALCKTNPSDHIGIWEGLNCQLRLEIHGNRFMAEGTYETPKNRLLAAYSALGVGAQSAPPGRRNVKYVGKLSGYSIEAEMIEEEDNKKVGSTTEKLLSALADRTKRTVLMVISDLFNEIWVYDNDDEPHRFYTLRKLRDGE